MIAGGVPVVVKPNEKAPAWTGWRSRNWSEKTLREAAASAYNIGVDCERSNITVIDIDSDDPSLAAYVLSEFGVTPLRVRTPRGGWHFYYRSRGERGKPFLRHPDQTWRLPIDVRGLGNQVVAPPSSRAEGRYEFERPDLGWVPFADLPPLPDHPALAFFRDPLIVPAPAAADIAGKIKAGSRSDYVMTFVGRGLVELNGHPRAIVEPRAWELAREALSHIDGEDDHPFTDAHVGKAIASPITYTVENRNAWGRKGGRRELAMVDIRALGEDGVADAAFKLLIVLRATYEPGREFAICPAGMAKTNMFPGWPVAKYRRARDRLQEARAITMTYKGGRGAKDSSRYILIPISASAEGVGLKGEVLDLLGTESVPFVGKLGVA